MNRKELVQEIAREALVSQETANICLQATLDTISKRLKARDKVVLVGFGTFDTKNRSARDGRNPKTGETIKIEATIVPGFKPGKKLKQAVNK